MPAIWKGATSGALRMVWINQALVQGKGRDWALAAVSRTW